MPRVAVLETRFTFGVTFSDLLIWAASGVGSFTPILKVTGVHPRCMYCFRASIRLSLLLLLLLFLFLVVIVCCSSLLLLLLVFAVVVGGGRGGFDVASVRVYLDPSWNPCCKILEGHFTMQDKRSVIAYKICAIQVV